jgi:ABC-type uncharacterized transport system permease subunit
MEITNLISFALTNCIAVSYAALGFIITEKSGVLNLGIEGFLSLSAFAAYYTASHTNFEYTGILIAILISGLLGLIYAYFVINLKTDQVLTGLILAIVCVNLGNTIGSSYVGTAISGLKNDVIKWSLIPSAIMTWFLLYKTTFGLTLRSIGENPEVAFVQGIKIERVRYIAVIIGAILMGIGGAHISLVLTPVWHYNISNNLGWLAYGLTLAASWKASRALFLCFAVGVLIYFQSTLQSHGISPYLLETLPPLFAIFVSLHRPELAPKSLGKPFQREINF